MKQDPTFIVIGRLGASYGLEGWHHVSTYTQPNKRILQYPVWYIAKNDDWKSYALLAGRVHGKSVVAHLEGVNTPEMANLLTQSWIAVERSALPVLPEGEYYWVDLEGLTVQTGTGTVLGCIDHLYDNAGTDVMVIRDKDHKECQIPFILNDTVVSVNLTEKIVVVDWVIAK